MFTMVTMILLIGVAWLLVQHYFLHGDGKLERNDIVLLKRKYKHRYPNISPGMPLRIINLDGSDVHVTFVKPSDTFIYNETVHAHALKKVV